MSAKSWVYTSLVGACLLTVSLAALRFYQLAGQRETALTRLEIENRELRLKLDHAAKFVPPPPAFEKAKPQTEPQKPSHGPQPAPPPQEGRTEPSPDSQLVVAELRERIRELEAAAAKAQEEQQRLTASAAGMEKALADRSRTLEEVESQAKSTAMRVAQLEGANRTLRDDLKASEAKAAGDLARWSRELEDINRRREDYLNSILRRYREITEQYRVLSARLDNPREMQTPPTTELARIQSAISMADEDLRQLRHLDIQAANLARKYRK
jgi:DNA repair exonuclease SbcCD ATPase subunit